MDEIINVTTDNVHEIISRGIKKEQDIFDFNMESAKRMADEITSKISSGEKLSIYELKRLASIAAQYELFLFDILDLPCVFPYPGHKDYSERLKTFRKKCIKKIKQSQKIFEHKIRLKEAEIKTQPPEIIIPTLKDNSELKEKAQNLLCVLSGKWLNGFKIMTDEEYVKVVCGVSHLIDTGQILPIDQKIKTNATILFIRKLFWTIHKELYTSRPTKDCFIKFLHDYFEQFNGYEVRTTKNQFSSYGGMEFEYDHQRILQSIKK